MKLAAILAGLVFVALAALVLVMIRKERGGLKKYFKPASPPPDPHRGYPAGVVGAAEIARRVALVNRGIAASGDAAPDLARPPSESIIQAASRQSERGSNEDIAYWATVKDLVAIGDIPVVMLEEARPVILGVLGKGADQAGRIVVDALRGIEWDWPLWYPFAEDQGYLTLDGIVDEVAAMTTEGRLGLLSRDDLVDLCNRAGAPRKAKDTRAVLIASLLASVPDGQLLEMTEDSAVARRRNLREGCRRQMASRLIVRIGAIAYHLERYDQLSDPDLLPLRPNWKFVCTADAPAHCQRFSGMTLPAAEAMSKFPPLPCGRLNCSCRITSAR